MMILIDQIIEKMMCFDLENFNKNSINIIPQNFVQTQYQQKYKDQNLRWLSNLSWIDYIFNVGKPY